MLSETEHLLSSIRTGELMLLGCSNCLVLFYDGIPTGYRHTRVSTPITISPWPGGCASSHDSK